jgi:hypothetical protein
LDDKRRKFSFFLGGGGFGLKNHLGKKRDYRGEFGVGDLILEEKNRLKIMLVGRKNGQIFGNFWQKWAINLGKREVIF